MYINPFVLGILVGVAGTVFAFLLVAFYGEVRDEFNDKFGG